MNFAQNRPVALLKGPGICTSYDDLCLFSGWRLCSDFKKIDNTYVDILKIGLENETLPFRFIRASSPIEGFFRPLISKKKVLTECL